MAKLFRVLDWGKSVSMCHEYNLRDRSFVSGLGLTFISVVMTGVAVGAGGSGAKSM